MIVIPPASRWRPGPSRQHERRYRSRGAGQCRDHETPLIHKPADAVRFVEGGGNHRPPPATRTTVIRIQLPDAEADASNRPSARPTDRKLRDRLQIVLLAHRGRTAPGHRRRPGHHPPHRPALAQRLPRPRARRPAAPQGQGAEPPAIPADLADEVRRWVIEGPAEQGLDRANWTHAELADHLLKTHGIRPAARPCSGSAASSASGPTGPTYRFLRGDPDKQAQAREDLADLEKKAEAGELVLLSQDEARFPMVPTLAATLGVKGHRPMVGTRDCKDLLYVFAVVNLVTGGAARQHAGEPGEGQAEDRQEQDPADAGGVRRPPAARRPAVPGGASTSGWCCSSTTPRGTGASRSTRRWRRTRTWSSSGCPATARS